jgi:hypothetical protein
MSYKRTSGIIGTTDGSVKIDEEGVYYNGNAIVYDDIAFNLGGKKFYTTVGKVDFDYDYIMPRFQSGGNITTKNDCVFGNEPYPHAFLTSDELTTLGYTGDDIKVPIELHAHWLQFNATDQYSLGIYIRILNNGSHYSNAEKGVFPTDTQPEEQWIYLEPTLGNNADGSKAPSGYTDNKDLFTFDKGTDDLMVQISMIAKFNVIINISAELQIWVTRIDDGTLATNDLLVSQIDFHCPKSANGSQDPYIKLK